MTCTAAAHFCVVNDAFIFSIAYTWITACKTCCCPTKWVSAIGCLDAGITVSILTLIILLQTNVDDSTRISSTIGNPRKKLKRLME
jgi:hypothetical protein